MMNKIEILSPAGGFDSVVAAVRSGADAVYIGAKEFSARASAKNFDVVELKTTVEYCHTRGVSVYLALNTLVFDDELQKAVSLAVEAAKCDIDAVIVQDIGLAQAIKKIVPKLRLHASTQMSVHTPAGAKALYEMGFARVVLAREMTLQEIQQVAESCPVELEVFVHGALCMSVSGQCYMSAMFGGRSANRGKCAQPCRLPFAVEDSTHALSLKDNSVVRYIRELESIGVTSAKIEGRMKRPEYVACATTACRQMRDNGYVDADTEKRLSAVFSRTGFTDGYLCNKRGYDMFGRRKKDDVVSADERLFKEIRNTYKDELPRVAVDFFIDIACGERMKLVAADGEFEVCVLSDDVVCKAENAVATADKIAQRLKKTGNTPFFVRNVDINIGDDCFVSAGVLNELRRTSLEMLSKKREKRHDYIINDITTDDIFASIKGDEYINYGKLKRVRACVGDLEIPSSFYDMDIVFAPLRLCADNDAKVKELMKSGINIGVEIPRGMFGAEPKISLMLQKVKSLGIKDVLCNNIGAVYLAKKEGFCVHAGIHMNITNSFSLLWAKDYGITDVELSIEADAGRINSLCTSLPIGVMSYGYLPLMLCRNCPVKSAGVDCATCKKSLKLQDRKGEQFSLLCDKITTEILNCVPLILPEKIYKSENVNFTSFHFYVENSVETKEKTHEKLSENRKFERFTHGLYIKGVK